MATVLNYVGFVGWLDSDGVDALKNRKTESYPAARLVWSEQFVDAGFQFTCVFDGTSFELGLIATNRSSDTCALRAFCV